MKLSKINGKIVAVLQVPSDMEIVDSDQPILRDPAGQFFFWKLDWWRLSGAYETQEEAEVASMDWSD